MIEYIALEDIPSLLAQKENYDTLYKERCRLSDEVIIHSEARMDLVTKAITTKFPNEPEYITTYKLQTFQAITKTYFNKVLTTIQRIQKSDDFIVTYQDGKVKSYCNKPICGYNDIISWYFGFMLKYLLQEPNGYVVVMPEYNIHDRTISLDPIPKLIPARNVLYESEHYIIYKDCETEDVFWYITYNSIYRIVDLKDKSNKAEYEITPIIEDHSLGNVFFKIGGIPYNETRKLYESFISGALPFWNIALLQNSEKIAGTKQHMHPTPWRYAISKCPECSGKGSIKHYDTLRNELKHYDCPNCNSGAAKGMFSEIVYTPPKSALDGDIMKPPFAGYIEKDFSSIEFINQDIKDNLYSALAALNMEFLMESPMNQSGVAKEMDRQELNSFLYQITSHIVNNNLYPLIHIMGKWLYINDPILYQNTTDTFVSISIPVEYDVTGSTNYEAKITQAKQSGASKYVINGYEKKLIESRFQSNTDDKNVMLLINKLDPYPQFTTDEKQSMLTNKTVTKESVVLSNNIYQIVYGLYWNTKGEGFMNFTLDKQLSLCYKEVKKIIKKSDEKPTSLSKVPEQQTVDGGISNGYNGEYPDADESGEYNVTE